MVAERRRIEPVHDHSRFWKRGANVGQRVDVIAMSVRPGGCRRASTGDRLAAQSAILSAAAARIDKRRDALRREDQEVAVARMRCVDLMADVFGLLLRLAGFQSRHAISASLPGSRPRARPIARASSSVGADLRRRRISI